MFIIIGVAWSGLGCGYYYLGDLDAALKYMEKGLDLTVGGGSEWWVSFHYLNLNKIHLEIGNLDKSRKFVEEGIDLKNSPVLLHRVNEDMRGLLNFAFDMGYQEANKGYVSKCHLCLDIRKYLALSGDFENLQPRQFYEQLKEENGIAV